MEKKTLTSATVPAAGPYAIAVEINGLVFVSGQLPVLPETGQMIMDIRDAARQAIVNLQTVLTENGLTLAHVAKTTLYLTRMADFATVNEVYAGFFAASPPARTTVEVSALPKGAPLEIEAIAVRT